MKLWQLFAVLGLEKDVRDRHLTMYEQEDGQVDVDELIVQKILKDSQLRYYVTPNNSLRLVSEDLQGDKILEGMSVWDAYKKYGADAITEVVDYGSYNL